MVEMHGGSVSVESEVGKGSRFVVLLPWRAADGAVSKEDSPDKTAGRDVPARGGAGGRAVKVLLAEDNATNINTLSTYLTAKGYAVVIAIDGGEAVRRAKEDQPDIILMDVQMPVVDGLQAIQLIRAEPSLASVPIIALTALAMPGDRERCMEMGANGYMSKPVSLKRLVEAIEAHLSE
jgi:CheY-like chemotaxis protein